MGSKDSLSRFIRCITGQAIGFVFSGGGARGLSYIGVYKALRELNIPIDYAGGSSSGALFSSLFALNYTPEEIIAIFRENFIHKLLEIFF